MSEDKFDKAWRRFVAFCALGGMAAEGVFVHPVDPFVMTACLAVLGVPQFVRTPAERARRHRDDD